jgi:hypothetical protein
VSVTDVQKSEPEPRLDLVAALREQIAQGTYMNEAKLRVLARLIEERELRGGRRPPKP